jgi:anthranilate synthase component I
MTEQEFAALAAQGFNRIPLTLETLVDLDTPLSIYLKLANQPYSYLLESVVGGERFGRYSIVGLSARQVLRVNGYQIQILHDGAVVEEHRAEDPLAFINAYEARFVAAPVKEDLRFVGGLVGYFGYDTVRYIEPKLAATHKPDRLGVPDILLMLSEELAVVDNLSGKLHLIVYADPNESGAYVKANARLQELRRKLRGWAELPSYGPRKDMPLPISEIGEQRYLKAVERCKQYVLDGDIMQVQISQRISLPFDAPPINLYRALRSINPSPYMFYLDLGGFQIVGASPEILVRKEKEKITLRPIAGTRRRGKTPEDDLVMERAEHLMLIDLGRNDVGRVAKTGSVKVTEQFIVERYSHVMHIVSNVEGEIKPGINNIDLLRATFPAGTVTGTAKVRAMEVIDELEPSKRGIYAGAVGYLGFNGNMDLAIAIRTAVIKDRTLYVQAAAGVVADSVAELEWKETENKARAVLRAAEMAYAGIDAPLV